MYGCGTLGATMGGGIGSLSGHRGLMVDSLKSVRMITARGELVEASKNQNADLFWPIRGAGSNFGVIILATYTVYDAPNNAQITNADFVFSASANESFWQIIKEFDDTLSSRLALTAVAFYDRIHGQISHLEKTRTCSMLDCCSPLLLSMRYSLGLSRRASLIWQR